MPSDNTFTVARKRELRDFAIICVLAAIAVGGFNSTSFRGILGHAVILALKCVSVICISVALGIIASSYPSFTGHVGISRQSLNTALDHMRTSTMTGSTFEEPEATEKNSDTAGKTAPFATQATTCVQESLNAESTEVRDAAQESKRTQPEAVTSLTFSTDYSPIRLVYREPTIDSSVYFDDSDDEPCTDGDHLVFSAADSDTSYTDSETTNDESCSDAINKLITIMSGVHIPAERSPGLVNSLPSPSTTESGVTVHTVQTPTAPSAEATKDGPLPIAGHGNEQRRQSVELDAQVRTAPSSGSTSTKPVMAPVDEQRTDANKVMHTSVPVQNDSFASHDQDVMQDMRATRTSTGTPANNMDNVHTHRALARTTSTSDEHMNDVVYNRLNMSDAPMVGAEESATDQEVNIQDAKVGVLEDAEMKEDSNTPPSIAVLPTATIAISKDLEMSEASTSHNQLLASPAPLSVSPAPHSIIATGNSSNAFSTAGRDTWQRIPPPTNTITISPLQTSTLESQGPIDGGLPPSRNTFASGSTQPSKEASVQIAPPTLNKPVGVSPTLPDKSFLGTKRSREEDDDADAVELGKSIRRIKVLVTSGPKEIEIQQTPIRQTMPSELPTPPPQDSASQPQRSVTPNIQSPPSQGLPADSSELLGAATQATPLVADETVSGTLKRTQSDTGQVETDPYKKRRSDEDSIRAADSDSVPQRLLTHDEFQGIAGRLIGPRYTNAVHCVFGRKAPMQLKQATLDDLQSLLDDDALEKVISNFGHRTYEMEEVIHAASRLVSDFEKCNPQDILDIDRDILDRAVKVVSCGCSHDVFVPNKRDNPFESTTRTNDQVLELAAYYWSKVDFFDTKLKSDDVRARGHTSHFWGEFGTSNEHTVICFKEIVWMTKNIRTAYERLKQANNCSTTRCCCYVSIIVEDLFHKVKSWARSMPSSNSQFPNLLNRLQKEGTKFDGYAEGDKPNFDRSLAYAYYRARTELYRFTKEAKKASDLTICNECKALEGQVPQSVFKHAQLIRPQLVIRDT